MSHVVMPQPSDPQQHDEWLRFAVFELYVSRGYDTSLPEKVVEAYELITGRPWDRTPQDAPRDTIQDGTGRVIR
jgi:hypothetical protein